MEVYDHQVITCYEMRKSFRAYLCFFSTLQERVILFLGLWMLKYLITRERFT